MPLSIQAINESQDLKAVVGLFNVIVEQWGGMNWIDEIVAHPLDEYVASHLSQYSDDQIEKAFDPCQVEENIAEAGRLLDANIGRLEAIKNLEQQAVFAVLDIVRDQASAEFEKKIAVLNLTAARALSHVAEPADPADKDEATVANLFAIASCIRKSRVEMHSQKGSALNFLERINFQRKLYAENAVTIYQRLRACQLGLANSFGIEISELPSWSAGDTNPLLAWIDWLRRAITMLETGERREVEFEHFMFLGRELISPQYVTDKLRLKGDIPPSNLQFSLTRDHLPSSLAIGEGDSVRILEIGIAPTFGESQEYVKNISRLMKSGTTPQGISLALKHESSVAFLRMQRQRFSFTFDVHLPDQTVRVNDKLNRWTREPLLLSGVGAWLDGPLSTSINFRPYKQIVNSSPFGLWKIGISNNVLDTHTTWSKSQLGEALDGSVEENFADLSLPKDLVIGLRLALRRKK